SIVDELTVEAEAGVAQPQATSLAWDASGSNLFVGYTDSTVRVFGVVA
ncbi:hypothetical protein JCM10207_002516, partial [Rhodosporidiobolus poonsookiae]